MQTEPSASPRPVLGLAFAAAALTACGGGGGGSSTTAPTPPVGGNALTIVQPAADRLVEPGTTVRIRIRLRSDLADRAVDVFADVDGNLATRGDQVVVQRGVAADDTLEAALDWDTSTTPAGSYTLVARTADTEFRARTATTVQVNTPPTNDVLAPTADTTISRGGFFSVTYTDDDPDDPAATFLFTDTDGDLGTTADQALLSPPLPQLNGATTELVVPASAVPEGSHAVAAATIDGVWPDASTSFAPGRLVVENQSWAQNLSDNGAAEAWDVAGLADGSTIIVGYFQGSIRLAGTNGGAGVQLTSLGGFDAFLVKLGRDGELIWANAVNGAGAVSASQIATLSDGSFVVVGGFEGNVQFGGSALTATSRGATDVFLARFARNGTPLWVQTAGGNGNDRGRAGLTVLRDDSVLVCGTYEGTAQLDNGNVTLPAFGGSDLFVARYDRDGNFRWVQRAGSTGITDGLEAAGFPDGSTVVAGTFDDDPLFGTGQGGMTRIPAPPSARSDVYLARYDEDGEFTWARRITGSSQESVIGVATFGDGSVTVAGSFQDAVVFALGEPNETTLTAVGQNDIYLASYDAIGTLRWAQQIGGPNDDNARGLIARPDGGSVVYGEFFGSTTFAPGITVPSLAAGDVFLAQYRLDGSYAWHRQTTGPGPAVGGTDVGHGGLAAFGDGSFVAIGAYFGSVGIGVGGPNATTLMSAAPALQYFAARFNADGGF